MKARKVIVLAIKPAYAKKIYEGKKDWEFRKKAPPLFEDIFIYESAPVSAITGKIVFSTAITGWCGDVWDLVVNNQCFTRNLPGISTYELQDYSKGKLLVTALRVCSVEKFDSPIPFLGTPPQNWGRYLIEEAK